MRIDTPGPGARHGAGSSAGPSVGPSAGKVSNSRLPAPVAAADDGPAESARADGPRPVDDGRPDMRHLSPRQMANLSLDLHMAGVLAYDEYALLAFQPDLHPNYDQTIGALTGEPARPDAPRDFVAEWEDRLAFEEKHGAADSDRVRRARRIVQVLRLIDDPTRLSV